MSTAISRIAVVPPVSSLSEMNAEHAASWERWRAAGAASDLRAHAMMRGVALAIGLGLAVWAVVLVIVR